MTDKELIQAFVEAAQRYFDWYFAPIERRELVEEGGQLFIQGEGAAAVTQLHSALHRANQHGYTSSSGSTAVREPDPDFLKKKLDFHNTEKFGQDPTYP